VIPETSLSAARRREAAKVLARLLGLEDFLEIRKKMVTPAMADGVLDPELSLSTFLGSIIFASLLFGPR